MEENEWMLIDRIDAIRKADERFDLRNNAYLSFSGGKDSTVLHRLIDMALPNNRIPRVFIDTGIEYDAIRRFVLSLAESDDRIAIIRPSTPIKPMLERDGYPFKSKEHSLRVDQFNKGHNANFIKKYISGFDHNGKPSRFVCPKMLLYQFEERGRYHYSNLCCQRLKKEPAKKWAKENGKSIVITGMRRDEGGNRARLGCVIFEGGKAVKFHPLVPVSEEWEEWLIGKEGIRLCELYYPPYNFRRTGCKGCPYSLDLADQLATMELYMPNERRQCEIIWKPVYDEYRRLNYRLRKDEQLRLF